MSNYGPPNYGPPSYGPPNQPPYGPPPYGGPPAPRGSSSATVVTALLAVAFVVAAALVGWAVNDQDSDRSTASGPVSGTSAVPLPGTTGGGGVPGAGGASPNGSATSALPTLPSATSSSYVPPTPPSPTREPLNPETINKTFQLYMQALLNRSLSQLKAATCPKLRYTETGTALDGKYINRWKGHRYTIYPSLDYVIIAATVRYVNPNTGGNGKTHVYSWYVTRYPNGRYWVCGFRG